MYTKIISFLVGMTSFYGITFYQVYLVSWITIPFISSFSGGIILMLYLAAGSPKHLYQGMQKYVVIGLLKTLME